MANQDLEELMQLAQLSHTLQAGDLGQQELNQRAQDARMQAAIHLLGLHQQQQQDAAQQALAQQGLAETTQYHQGSLAHEQAQLDAAAKDRQATLAETIREHDIGVQKQDTRDKANLVDALITHGLQPGDPRIGHVLKAAGYGDIGSAMEPTVNPQDAEKLKQLADATERLARGDHGGPQSSGPSMATTTPGYYPSLSADKIKYAPIDTANLGALAYNSLVVPPFNLINSIVGMGPVKTAPYMPRDYGIAWENLLKPQPLY